jgi:uncharacterized RDD family membrane protein YckC
MVSQSIHDQQVAAMSNESIDLRDQLSIETPELVGIEFPLAGIGSRCVALLVDYFVQGFSFVVFVIVIVLIFAALPHIPTAQPHMQSTDPGKWAIALMILIPFLLQWGYFALFEAFWNGQTPGKRLLRLRVIQQSGRSIGLFESMGRNLLRMIDMLPGFYLIGAVCIFATRRQQRLGDMVAGTLVVHSVPTETSILPAGTRTFTAASLEPPPQPVLRKTLELPADGVARLSRADLQLLENFLARRLDLPLDVRASLAERLTLRMKEKTMLEVPSGASNETFLEALVAGLRDAGGMHS